MKHIEASVLLWVVKGLLLSNVACHIP